MRVRTGVRARAGAPVAALLACAGFAGCVVGAGGAGESPELAALRARARDARTELASAEARLRALTTELAASEAEARGLAEELESVGVKVTPRGASIGVVLADRLLFDAGQVLLHDAAKAKLRRVAGVLRKRFPDRLVSIEGHTDSTPPDRMASIYPTNWELSTARAMSVLRFLTEEAGMAPARVCAAGFADCRPVAEETSDDARAANRRVEIVVQPPLGTARVTAAFGDE